MRKSKQKQYKFLYEYTLWIATISLAFLNTLGTQLPKFTLLTMLFGIDAFFNLDIANAEKSIPPVIVGVGYTLLALYRPELYVIELLSEIMTIISQYFFEAKERTSLYLPILLLSGLTVFRGLPKAPYIQSNIFKIAPALFITEKVLSLALNKPPEKANWNAHFCRKLDSEAPPSLYGEISTRIAWVIFT